MGMMGGGQVVNIIDGNDYSVGFDHQLVNNIVRSYNYGYRSKVSSSMYRLFKY